MNIGVSCIDVAYGFLLVLQKSTNDWHTRMQTPKHATENSSEGETLWVLQRLCLEEATSNAFKM